MDTRKQPDRPTRRIETESGRVPLPAIALCVLGAGCTPLSEHIAEEATPIAAEEAVETIAQPENAQAVARLLTDPAVQAAIRDVSQEAALGMLGLAGDGRADVRRLSDEMVRAVTPSLAGGVRRDLSPALEAMVRQGTEAAFEEAFSSASLGRVRAFGTAMTRETVRTLSDETATVLVPSVVSSLFASADAAAGEIDLARIENAVGRVSYVAAHDAVLGANDGLRALQHDRNRFFLASAGREIERTLSWLPWLAIPLGLLLVVGTLSLAWLAYGVNRDRRALAQRDEAVGLVMHLMLAAEDRPWSAEFRELIREHVRDVTAGISTARNSDRAGPRGTSRDRTHPDRTSST